MLMACPNVVLPFSVYCPFAVGWVLVELPFLLELAPLCWPLPFWAPSSPPSMALS